MKLKASQVEKVRASLMKMQGYTCVLCGHAFGPKGKKPALDHDHKTGYIRDVLCLHCNGMLGKAENGARRAVGKDGDAVEWIRRVHLYLQRHTTPRWSNAARRGLIYPTHQTENDKRLKRLAAAKKKRERMKAMKT